MNDERQDKVRIGFKRNGYGMKTADIHSEKPVPEIVRDALQEMLRKNGHSIGGANEKVALKATVTNFWFDYKTGFWTVEFIGNTQIEVSLVNQQTNETVFNEKFEGYYSEKSGGGLNKTWQRVMNAALNDLIQKINLSPDFKEALEGLSHPSGATQIGPGTS